MTRFHHHQSAVVLAALLLAAAPGRAEIITLGAARDNTLIQVPSVADPQLSNGRGPVFFVGRNNEPDGRFRRRGLIYFDVAGSIPQGSIITSVSLTLEVTNPGGVGADVIQLQRLLTDWGEGSSFAGGGGGAPAQPPDATWFYNRFNTGLWSTPGGDFADSASAGALVSGLGLHTWASTPALVADVQGWLDNPAANFGWLLLGEETQPRNVHGFATREAENAAGPRLTIEYAVIPEPGSFVLFVAGIMCTLGYATRRRLVPGVG